MYTTDNTRQGKMHVIISLQAFSRPVQSLHTVTDSDKTLAAHTIALLPHSLSHADCAAVIDTVTRTLPP